MKGFSQPHSIIQTKIVKESGPQEPRLPLYWLVKALLHKGKDRELASEMFFQYKFVDIDQSRFPDCEPLANPSSLVSTTHTPKTTTTIDWRHEICHFLHLDPNKTDEEVFQELQKASAKMIEAERVKQNSATHQGPLRPQVIHRVRCAASTENGMYLEQPWTVHAGQGRFHLRGSEQVRSLELYLERNKDVTFLVIRDYVCCEEKSHLATRTRLEKEIDSQPVSMPVEEHIEIVSDDLQSRLARLSDVLHLNLVEDEQEMGSGYDEEDASSDYNRRDNPDACYPYLWFYHHRFTILEAIERLEEVDQEHLNLYFGYIENRMSDEWAAVNKLVSKGEITSEYLGYIYVSILTKFVILVSHYRRFQETSYSGHPKAALHLK